VLREGMQHCSRWLVATRNRSHERECLCVFKPYFEHAAWPGMRSNSSFSMYRRKVLVVVS